MALILTAGALRALAGQGPPDRSAWSPLLAASCVLRIGSRPTLYGRAAVETTLAAFLDGIRSFGRCGCDVTGGPELYLVETDLSLARCPEAPPLPCVFAIRSNAGLVQDLRVYLDLGCIPGSAFDLDRSLGGSGASPGAPSKNG